MTKRVKGFVFIEALLSSSLLFIFSTSFLLQMVELNKRNTEMLQQITKINEARQYRKMNLVRNQTHRKNGILVSWKKEGDVDAIYSGMEESPQKVVLRTIQMEE